MIIELGFLLGLSMFLGLSLFAALDGMFSAVIEITVLIKE